MTWLRTLLAGLLLATVLPLKAQERTPDWLYRVQPGDTLIALSAAWMAPPRGWQDLQRLNRVEDPLRLMPGRNLRLPIAWLKTEAAVAEAVFVKGTVTLKRPGQADARLSSGSTLRSGDTLRTGEQASASLRFADGSRLLITPDSEVALEQLLMMGRGALPMVKLRLNAGGAENRVTPNPQHQPVYELRTPKLNLGVRGTEFRVRLASNGEARAQVDEGAVTVGGDKAPLGAGQGLVDRDGQRQRAVLLPAPALAALPLIERLPLRLSWPATPAGATAWRVQVFAQGQPDQLLLETTVAEPRVTWPLAQTLPDGDYTLKLRGIDNLGLEGAAAQQAFALRARPEPPFIQSPAADAVVYADRLAFAWSLNAAAPRVRLQIARDADFRELVLQPPPIDGATQTLALPYGRYHWRVASVDGARSGPWGDPQRFELREPPPSPPPATPTLEGNQLQLRWPASPGVVAYELEWATQASFEGARSLRTDTPSLTLPKPAPGHYHLRVRALNAAGISSPWGQAQLIDIPEPPSRWPWLLLPVGLVILF